MLIRKAPSSDPTDGRRPAGTFNKGAVERGNIHAPLLWDVTIVTCCKRTFANDSRANSMCKHYQDAAKQTALTDAHCYKQRCSTEKRTEVKKTKALQFNIRPVASLLCVGFILQKGSEVVWNPSVKLNKAHPKNWDQKGGWWPDSTILSKTIIKLVFKHKWKRCTGESQSPNHTYQQD